MPERYDRIGRMAPTDHAVHPLIAYRWSPRAISPAPVETDKLLAVFEAARWAPSSFNEQPWRFLVGTVAGPDRLAELRGYLSEGNAWALRAPVLVASAYKTTFTRNDRPNRMALRDLGAAEENAFLEAFHQGLVMHQMAGFDHERLANELFPDGFQPGSMWVIGYPGDADELSEKRREQERAPRKRRPLEDIVFGAEWETSPDFL